MNLSIRYATKIDAAMIADISRQTFYETFAADNTKEDMDKFLNEQFTKGKLMLEVGARENTFLLAYAEDNVAGYVKLREGKVLGRLDAKSSIEVARIYVMKDFIGRGVGAMLMNACIEIAKEQKKKTMWLGVWEKNERAIRFYTRYGFEKFGECDFLLGNDIQRDWLMKKNLTL